MHEAANNAFEALDIIRGLWNLFATRGRWTHRFGSSSQKPLGLIRKGHYHTLHHRNRQPIEDFFWYDLEYTGEREIFDPSKGWDRIEKERKWALARIRRSPFGRNDSPRF